MGQAQPGSRPHQRPRPTGAERENPTRMPRLSGNADSAICHSPESRPTRSSSAADSPISCTPQHIEGNRGDGAGDRRELCLVGILVGGPVLAAQGGRGSPGSKSQPHAGPNLLRRGDPMRNEVNPRGEAPRRTRRSPQWPAPSPIRSGRRSRSGRRRRRPARCPSARPRPAAIRRTRAGTRHRMWRQRATSASNLVTACDTAPSPSVVGVISDEL
jgi:hypothetical protein